MIPYPEEVKAREIKRKTKHMVLCKDCGKYFQDEECCGICESCRLFYLDECAKEFGIE